MTRAAEVAYGPREPAPRSPHARRRLARRLGDRVARGSKCVRHRRHAHAAAGPARRSTRRSGPSGRRPSPARRGARARARDRRRRRGASGGAGSTTSTRSRVPPPRRRAPVPTGSNRDRRERRRDRRARRRGGDRAPAGAHRALARAGRRRAARAARVDVRGHPEALPAADAVRLPPRAARRARRPEAVELAFAIELDAQHVADHRRHPRRVRRAARHRHDPRQRSARSRR